MYRATEIQIEICDPRMEDIVSPTAVLIQLDDSSGHTEGPVYIPADDSVIWSDVSGDRVRRWHQKAVTIWREPAHFQNGNALDLEGRIVACSHGDRAIVRQEHSGQWRILVDRYQGKQLNSPNDITVKSDGTLWFTDPPFGLSQPNQGGGGDPELPGSYVFRFDPKNGDLDAVIKEMIRPNGLVFSPDESLLYVSDTSAYEDPDMYHHIRQYRVVEGRKVTNGQTFAVVSPGQPDGMCVDQRGNLFVSAQDGIQVYSPAGQYLGKMPVPEICANVTFGGVRRNRLFIAAGSSLYVIDLKTQGV